MSLIISRRMGEPSWPASTMPTRPPSEVPIQSTRSAPVRAISATMSAQYCGRA
jgi:hypothetical protein